MKTTGYKLTREHDLVRVLPSENSASVNLNLVSFDCGWLIAFMCVDGVATLLDPSGASRVQARHDTSVWVVANYSTRREIWPDDPDVLAAREFALRYIETNMEVTAL